MHDINEKINYVVTMYRLGNRQLHSYVLGVYDDPESAKQEANKEEESRCGSYRAEILKCPLNITSIDEDFEVLQELTSSL